MDSIHSIYRSMFNVRFVEYSDSDPDAASRQMSIRMHFVTFFPSCLLWTLCISWSQTRSHLLGGRYFQRDYLVHLALFHLFFSLHFIIKLLFSLSLSFYSFRCDLYSSITSLFHFHLKIYIRFTQSLNSTTHSLGLIAIFFPSLFSSFLSSLLFIITFSIDNFTLHIL